MPHKVSLLDTCEPVDAGNTLASLKSDWNKTSTHHAQHGELEQIENLVNVWRLQGWPRKMLIGPLSVAVRFDQDTVVGYLVRQGAEVTGDMLRQAAETGSLSCLGILLDDGWDVNKALGVTSPPVLAYALKDTRLTSWLLARGANPNARCQIDCTPLSFAVQLNLSEVVKHLLSHGGDVQCGQLVHYAVEQEATNMELLAKLVEQGAPINEIRFSSSEGLAQTETEYQLSAIGVGTPLHTAIGARNFEAIRYLVNHGARLEIRDLWDRTPYQLALDQDLPSEFLDELAMPHVAPRG